MGSTATLNAKLALDNSAFVRGMRQSMAVAGRLGGQMRAIANAGIKIGMVGLTAGLLAGSAAMIGMNKEALALGGKFNDMGARTGAMVSKLVVANQAFAAGGLGSEMLETSIAKMQKTIANGSDAFALLGINLDTLRDQAPVDQLEAIGAAIAAIQDPAQRTKMAMDIFGKSGAQLLSVFRDPAAFNNARAILGSMPAVLQKNVGMFDDLGDAIEGMRVKWDQFSVGFAAGMAPQIKQGVDAINSVDFTPMGIRLGDAVASGFNIAKAAVKDPGDMFMAYAYGFDSVARGFGNSLIAAWKYAGDVGMKTIAGAFEGLQPTARQFINGLMDMFASGLTRSLSFSIGTIGQLLPGAIGEPFRKISASLATKSEEFSKNMQGAILPNAGKLEESFAKAVESTAFVKKDYLGSAEQARIAAGYVDQAKASSGAMLKNFIASGLAVAGGGASSPGTGTSEKGGSGSAGARGSFPDQILRQTGVSSAMGFGWNPSSMVPQQGPTKNAQAALSASRYQTFFDRHQGSQLTDDGYTSRLGNTESHLSDLGGLDKGGTDQFSLNYNRTLQTDHPYGESSIRPGSRAKEITASNVWSNTPANKAARAVTKSSASGNNNGGSMLQTLSSIQAMMRTLTGGN